MNESSHEARQCPQPSSTASPDASYNRVGALVLALAVCFATEAIGGLLTAQAVRDWYPGIRKPSWTPPDWLFGPVWTLLFVLMAVSVWIFACRARGQLRRVGLSLFLGQLVLNALWSGLFFASRNPGLALAEIIVLWVNIAATLLTFRLAANLAAGLLVPYLLWVSYATALNGAIWAMNS